MKTQKMPKAPKGVKVSVRLYKQIRVQSSGCGGGACSGGGNCGR